MSIDPRYVASADLQEYLVDKDSGFPLAGGKVTFYEDDSRTNLKTVYTISGTPPNYSFVALPNPVILSAVGTIQDDDGNDVIPYYLPFQVLPDGTITDNPQLYYVTVYSANGDLQFTREGWPPNAPSGGTTPEEGLNLFNFIPNGQFLIHNNLLATENVAQGGSTDIAQGGWTFEIPSMSASTNLITFNPFGSWVDNPPESPAFSCNIQCTVPSSGDAFKILRCKFEDVNKFADDINFYTLGFWAQSNGPNVNININLTKNFGSGGSSETSTLLETITITSNGTFFTIPFVFGDNAGETIGSGSFVSLDAALPVSISFNLLFTDFALVVGNVALENFPVQTNADMMTRSVFGWANLPDYNAQDLYLPPLLTPYGMTWDQSVVGKIESSIFPVTSPNSTSPFPISNDMLCDGTSYLFQDFSTIGIPFSRLGNKLISNSPVTNIPQFGTGTDFATGYVYSGLPNSLRLTVNSNGTGIPGASDGNTGWTIGSIVTYGASVTGSNSLNYTAYSNVANTVLAVGNFITPNSAASAGTSGFTVDTLNFETGLLSQQFYAITILTVAGSALSNPGGPGKYFQFSDDTTDYYIWFFFTNETDPAPGGTGIKINCSTSESAQDIANLVREAMNAYQISQVNVSGVPLAGHYWLFSSHPGAVQNYYVWYTVNGAGSDPAISGRIGIKVAVLGTDNAAAIVTKTQLAINSYQYAAPDFRGMFPRGFDPTGIWDLDVAQRWSSISGLSGAHLGTFEYQQFLVHQHQIKWGQNPPGTTYSGNDITGRFEDFTFVVQGTDVAGGSETRPVNFYVNWIIKY